MLPMHTRRLVQWCSDSRPLPVMRLYQVRATFGKLPIPSQAFFRGHGCTVKVRGGREQSFIGTAPGVRAVVVLHQLTCPTCDSTSRPFLSIHPPIHNAQHTCTADPTRSLRPSVDDTILHRHSIMASECLVPFFPAMHERRLARLAESSVDRWALLFCFCSVLD